MSQFESDPKKWLPPIPRASVTEPSRREEERAEGFFYQDDDYRLWESREEERRQLANWLCGFADAHENDGMPVTAKYLRDAADLLRL